MRHLLHRYSNRSDQDLSHWQVRCTHPADYVVPLRELFLKKALLEAQRNLQDAYTGLANVKDPDLIDCYIYEVNAANLRYQVILRDYKQLESQKKKTDAISQSRNCQTASAPLFPHA